jgi:single-strand DNA-binding protein
MTSNMVQLPMRPGDVKSRALTQVRKGETASAIGRVDLNRRTGQDGQQYEALQLIADTIVSARSARPGGRKKSNEDRREYSKAGQAGASLTDTQFDDDLPF